MQRYTPIILSIIILTGCGKNSEMKEETAPTPSPTILTISSDDISTLGVEFSEATMSEISDVIILPASTIIDQAKSGAASSLVEGKIREVKADYGERVSKGDPLATIESMRIGELVSDALRTRTEAETARKEYERLKSLHSEKASSDKILQRAESDYLASKAQYDGTVQQLIACGMTEKEMQSLFSNPNAFTPVLTIRAPISGTVATRNAMRGGKVQPNDELFTIVNNTTVTVQGNAFQEHLHVIHPGMKVEFTTEAFPEEHFEGTLTTTGAVLDKETHTLPFWCEIPNPKGMLKPNLNGELSIQTGKLRTALSVPSEALIYDGNDTYVFLDEGNGKLEYRQVQAGQIFSKRIEIMAGLSKGDRVASAGVFMLKSRFKLSQMQEEE